MSKPDEFIYPISTTRRIHFKGGHFYPERKILWWWNEFNSRATEGTVWLPTLKTAIDWIKNTY